MMASEKCPNAGHSRGGLSDLAVVPASALAVQLQSQGIRKPTYRFVGALIVAVGQFGAVRVVPQFSLAPDVFFRRALGPPQIRKETEHKPAHVASGIPG